MEQNHQTYRVGENIPVKEQICLSVAQVGETGPVIMPPSRIRTKFFTSALLSVLMCLLLLSPAKAVERDQALKQSGLHYPDGMTPTRWGVCRAKSVASYTRWVTAILLSSILKLHGRNTRSSPALPGIGMN
jgi:hypothetical protein